MTQGNKYSSREDQALAEAGRTAISAAQKRLLTSIFILAIFFVPVSRQVLDVRAYFAGSRSSPAPQCYDIFKSAFSALKGCFLSFRSDGRLIAGVLEANRRLLTDMRDYENALEDNSLMGRTIRPFVQYAMTSWLGAGNDKAYCGRQQWLFYRPDVDYVINRGFLDADVLARRAATAGETASTPQPDPLKAISAFNAELAGRGIKLIVMPTPVKPVIHPEKFAAGFENQSAPLQNRSYRDFIGKLEAAGVLVFDPAEALINDKMENKREEFLAGDTHWRPEAMELCARNLKDFIRANVTLPAISPAGYAAAATNIIQRGDIVTMLRLPKAAGEYAAEETPIRQIFNPDSSLWRPDRGSDVLVLGDSFGNIYSLGSMGWGTGAGFVEQLSYEMDRKIDRIVINDNGAWAAREVLRKESIAGVDRLAGKRVVIWQFAVRELAEGDWKIFNSKGRASPASFLSVSAGSGFEVEGRIKAVARVPRPGSVPYADHIMALHLVELRQGTNEHGQALVYMLSMTNHVLTRAASLKAGETVRLRLRSWPDVSAAYERINRTDLDDPGLLVQQPCWGELEQ